MIKVLFFAQVRELVNTDSLTLDGAFENVAALRAHLAAQGDRWALALDEGKLLAAVNQTLVELTHPLADGDGYIYQPDVDPVAQMVNLISTSRNYQAGVEMLTTAKELALATLTMGR